MTAFSVVVPYRPDNGHRDRAWDWIERRWRETLPEAELIESLADPGDHPGEFNHPAAINRGVDAAEHDVIVIADADTAFAPNWVRQAVEMVANEMPWVLPRRYVKLSKPGTKLVLEQNPAGEVRWEHDTEWVGDSVNWSGLVVVPREAFEAVNGYDERWQFWGADDIAFGLTMDALWGRHYRLEGAAYHFWHPTPPEHNYGHSRHVLQDALMRRYLDAAEDAEALREVRFG